MLTSEDLKRSVAAGAASCMFLLTSLHVMAGPTTEWTVSGTVVDSIHGHPLSAIIEMPGTGINPVEVGPDGQYSIDLPESQAFELITTAIADGYEVALTTVGPLTEDVIVDIQVEPDLADCMAPGYYKDFTTYYSETFETDDGGYTTDAPGFELPWEWGTPTAWPNECKVGKTCWGTNLDDDFQVSGHEHLTSISIDLSAATDVDGLTLYWDQAWDLFSSHDATAQTRINSVVETVWQNVGNGRWFWKRISADVLDAAGTTMTVRWTVDASSSTPSKPGLFIDNVRVKGFECSFDELPPTIDPAPASIEVQMVPDETHSEPWTLTNRGDQSLEWAVETRDTASSRSINDFSGYYDPSNWRLINSPPETGGFIDEQAGPPTELYIMGGDEGIVGFTELQITIPRDGEVSFDWGYETPVVAFTDAGYMLNDSYTSLAHTFEQVDHFEESETISVEAGDVLGFRVQLHQGYSGPGEFGITNFDAPTCDSPTSVDWLSFSEVDGSVGANDSEIINVEFDTGGLLPGSYETTLCLISNDPLNPVLFIPVNLTVQAPAHYGTISGQIDSLGYCSDDPGPAANAGIEIAGISSTWNINADENGEYSVQIDSGESPIDITASLPDHLDGVESGLMLGAGATEVVDFDLLLDAPCARTDPESLAITVAEDGSATEYLDILNVGGAINLDWNQFLHEPQGMTTAPGSMPDRSSFAVPAYSIAALPNQGYVTLDALDPQNLTTIEPEPPPSLYAGAFVENDFSRQIVLQSITHILGELDTQTGNHTEIGTVTGAPPEDLWLTMTWDHLTGTLYAVHYDFSDSRLFTIDLQTLEATEIGIIDGPGLASAPLVAAIAASFEGQLYGIDIVDDILLEIDMNSAEAVEIGALGFSADDVHDMDFDHSGNVLYWARYHDINSESQIMTIDTGTGAATLVGDVENGSSLWNFSIASPTPCASPNSVDWLEVTPISGTIGPGSTDTLALEIDADGLAEGTYEAQICIETNDPRRLIMAVPVELEVAAIDPPDIHVVPTSLSISLADDESDTQVFSVSNQGEQRLDWSVTEIPSGCALPGWADVTPGSGSVDESDNMAVFVDFDADGLAPDTYHATACIQSNDPATPLTEVDLQLTVVERALSLDKSLIDAPDPIVAGSTLEYRIEATNTGDIELENVMVSDNLINPSSHSCSNLPVSGTCMLEGTYTVTIDDMADGIIINTAAAEADGVAQITVEHREIVDENVFADRFEAP